jgi:hypothetical protein
MPAKKRQHRATSKAAHDSIKEHKSVMYEKIKAGLEKLKVGGTYCEIAVASGLKPEQTCKRLPEMIELGVVYNVGTTRKTPSGRKAMIRQLVGLKYKEGELPVFESTKKQKKQVVSNQEPLFTL